ncbi:hypothetical protein QTV44_002541 [Vibrio vulnificus]|nr:hypothetical protein [Vibrio vulnificus]
MHFKDSELDREFRRDDALLALSNATSRLFKSSLLSDETLLLLLFHLNEHHHDHVRLTSLVDQIAYLPNWSSADFDDFKSILIATIEEILIENGWQAFTFDAFSNHYVLTGSLVNAIIAPLCGFMDADLSSIKARHQATLTALKTLTSPSCVSTPSMLH